MATPRSRVIESVSGYSREIGQLVALGIMLALILWWRRRPGFTRQAVIANVLILAAGFLLMQYQLAGYFMGGKV